MDDLDKAALSPKTKALMDEAENKSDQLDILIALASRQCDVSEAHYEEFVAYKGKWCKHNKKSSKMSIFALAIASSALLIDLSRHGENSVLIKVAEFIRLNWYLFFG